MKKHYRFTAVLTKEGKWFVAQCAEPEVASQGKTFESAINNPREAIALYLRDADVS